MLTCRLTIKIKDYFPKTDFIPYSNYICLFSCGEYQGQIPFLPDESKYLQHQLKNISSDIKYKVLILDFNDMTLIGMCEMTIAYKVLNRIMPNNGFIQEQQKKLIIDTKTKRKLFGTLINSGDIYLKIYAEVSLISKNTIQQKQKNLKLKKNHPVINTPKCYIKYNFTLNKSDFSPKSSKNYNKSTMMNSGSEKQTLNISKQEKENDMNNFYYKNRIKRINKALNYNSNPTEKRETNYLLLNSNPNESNKKIQIENSVNYMTTNNKNDILIDNYIITPKHNYFKSINHNNTYLNLKRKEKKSNNIHQFCQSPDINNYSKKNVSPKKTYYNKSQEIIKDDITSRQKLNTKTKRNYYSILDTKRDDNDNKIKYSNSNNTQRKNKVLNDKIFNMSNINKKLKNNFFVNWTKNFKKVNYRDKILYKQNEQEYT